jgi:hypothetical protein
MSDWFGFEPMACCPECGEWIPVVAYRDGLHVCDADARIEHQVMRARHELTRIEWELASYLATPRARNLLEFTRYLERRHVGASPAAGRAHGAAVRPGP